VGNARVGHFFEPFSLERLTLNRNNTFMERSLADTFAPSRNLGAMIFDSSDDLNGTWALGTFRTGSDDFGDDVGDNGEQSATGRITWLPYYDEPSGGRYFVHTGVAYTFRDADEGIVRFRQTPEVRLGALGEGSVPFFVDTGNIAASNSQAVGAELAWVHGPLSIQGEYMLAPVNQSASDTAYFHAAYVFVSCFLTGEHRPYNRTLGAFDRVVPFENFFRVMTDQGIENGRGAWEIAARWSMIDLDDAGVTGGVLNDATISLNWYLNPYTRVKAEYIHAFLDTAVSGESDCDIVGMRFDIDF
jgi:phosphate-selective porin OprO/OprP